MGLPPFDSCATPLRYVAGKPIKEAKPGRNLNGILLGVVEWDLRLTPVLHG